MSSELLRVASSYLFRSPTTNGNEGANPKQPLAGDHGNSAKRQRPSNPHETIPQRLWSRLGLLLPALLTFPVCLSVALEPDHSDSSLFLYIGQAWADGRLPYVQNFDNKPPGIFALIALVSHFSRSLWWIALAQFVFVMGTIFGVRSILKRAGAPKRAVFFGTLCATLAVNIPYYLPGNMTESYMNCPMVLGVLLFLCALKSHQLRYFFLSGVCAGFACLFKPFGLSALLAQVAFLLLCAVSRRSIRSGLGSIAASLLGAVAAWVLPVLYFWRRGALMEMLDASFLYNVRYGLSSSYSLSSLKSAIRIPPMLASNLLPVSTMVACLVLGSYFAYKARTGLPANRRQMWAFLSLWFVFGLMLVLAAGRGYEQYFISLLPALGLAAGMFFWWSEEQLHGSRMQPVIASLVLAPVFLAYFPALAAFSTPARLIFSYRTYVAPDEMVSRELRRVSTPEETLIVFGYEPWVFYSTQMQSVSRYRSTHYVYDSARSYVEIGDEILKDMQKTPPDFIVVGPLETNWSPADGDPFKDQFMEKVNHSYVEFSEVQGYLLYRRK